MATWREQAMAAGRAEGLAEGRIEGRVWVLVSMTRHRFGEAAASTVAASLESVTSEAALEVIGTYLLTCPDSDALIAKIRQV